MGQIRRRTMNDERSEHAEQGEAMTVSVEQIILDRISEIRESQKAIFSSIEASRGETSEWRQIAENRMSTLEAEMKTVLGKEQPGRLAMAEMAVGELKLFKAQAVALGSAIGGLIGIISAVVGWLFPRK
jgi:hypothetical protein